jgi:hypothetical protein
VDDDRTTRLQTMGRVASRARTKVASTKVLARSLAPSASSDAPLEERLRVISSFRVATPERLEMLRTVTDRLDDAVGRSAIELHVADASDEPFSSEVRTILSGMSMRATHHCAPGQTLCEGLLTLLDGCPTEYVYLQFDDQLTTNLSPELLGSACDLLDRFAGAVDVVTVLWPLTLSVMKDPPAIEATAYAARRGRAFRRYQFGGAPLRRATIHATVDGHRFAVFENFTFGFYFNHIVTRAADYAERLRWYMEHLSTASAHQIELAACDRTLGPHWRHLAVPLDGVTLLDLDHQHTPSAVRAEGELTRQTAAALAAGAAVRVRHLDLDAADGASPPRNAAHP